MQVAVALTQKCPEPAPEAARKNLTLAFAGPGSAPIKLHRTLLLLAKKPVNATQFADSWMDGHAKDVAFAMYLGDSALTNGDLANAERRYRGVLAQQAQHSMALNNLAWLLARQNKPGAVAMAR
jgi:hypothetical protein